MSKTDRVCNVKHCPHIVHCCPQDVRCDTLNIDISTIMPALSERTRAIVVVHYAGIAVDMDPIMDLAKTRGLIVVEDNAHGFLSTYKGRALGTIGHFGCLSFHYTKNIICGEGGALLVNDPAYRDRAYITWEKGTNRFEFINKKARHWFGSHLASQST